MPKLISATDKHNLIHLMTLKDESGQFEFGQREIEKMTNLSRPYIRKIAREIGHQFPRNGIEVRGVLCMCTECGGLFRKPPSRVERATNQFCCEECRIDYSKGIQHPSWKDGSSVTSFSSWIKSQAAYKYWREQVLERDGYRCQISGRTDNLDAHHIAPKQETLNPEKALDVENGITLNKEVHIELHKLVREGNDYQEAIKILKERYDNN